MCFLLCNGQALGQRLAKQLIAHFARPLLTLLQPSGLGLGLGFWLGLGLGLGFARTHFGVRGTLHCLNDVLEHQEPRAAVAKRCGG